MESLWWIELYNWLGEQAEQENAEDDANELSVNLDESVGHYYTAEAYLAVREQMRRKDSTLPVEKVDKS